MPKERSTPLMRAAAFLEDLDRRGRELRDRADKRAEKLRKRLRKRWEATRVYQRAVEARAVGEKRRDQLREILGVASRRDIEKLEKKLDKISMRLKAG